MAFLQSVEDDTMPNQASLIAASGRVLIALIFLMSGFGKIASPSMTMGYISAANLPFPLLAYIVAVVVEVGGGILLVAGFQTRAVAAVLAIFTVVTALAFHSAFSDQNQMIHFLKNISMAGGLLQLVAFGAGSFSIDNWRTGSRLSAHLSAA
jgi:putative oxidoreductase